MCARVATFSPPPPPHPIPTPTPTPHPPAADSGNRRNSAAHKSNLSHSQLTSTFKPHRQRARSKTIDVQNKGPHKSTQQTPSWRHLFRSISANALDLGRSAADRPLAPLCITQEGRLAHTSQTKNGQTEPIQCFQPTALVFVEQKCAARASLFYPPIDGAVHQAQGGHM